MKPLPASLFLPLLTGILCCAAPSAQGAVFNWTGAASGDWGTAGNWDAGVPASATATTLVFDNATQLTTNNNIAGGLTLNSLALTANSGIRTLSGNKLTFDGTSPFLTMQNAVGASGSDNTTIGTPIHMNQTLSTTGGVDFGHQLLLGSAAVFSGTGGLMWSGGLGFVSATNTYSGLTTIAGGLLGVNQTGAFGSSASVTVQSGGSLQIQGTPLINKPLSLAGPGAFGLSTLHGSGSGTKTWSGAVTLANNASAGAINGALLALNGTVALGANTLTVAASSTSALSIFGAITGAGGLTKTGTGTLFRSSTGTVPTSTYTGPTLISEGKVSVQRNTAFGSSSLITLAPGAEIELRSLTNSSGQPIGGATVSRPLLLGGKLSSGAPISNSDGSPELWTGAVTLSGDATLSASGAGALAVPSTLQIFGGIALGGFTLNLTPDGTSSRHVVQVTSGITGSGAVNITTGSGKVILDGAGASTFTGPVSVNGNLSHGFGDNFGNVANTVTFTGGSLVTFTNSASIAAHPFVISGAGGLVFVPGSFACIIGANISGPGPVTYSGIGIGTGGVITLTGNNTFTGGMTVGSETSVAFSADTQLGTAGGPVTFAGGGLHSLVNATFSNARTVTLTVSGGRFSAPDGVTLTVPNNISGAGRLTIAGGSGGALGGTVVLAGTNTQAGGTVVEGATLEAGGEASLGGPGGVLNFGRFINSFTIIPGRLRATGPLTVAATHSTAFRNLIVDTNGHDVTFNQPLTGLGLTKEGAGVLRLNTANPDTSNDNSVDLQAGTLRLGVDHAIGSTRNSLAIAAGAVFDVNNFRQQLKSLTGTGEVRLGTGTLTIKDTFGSSFDGVISGTGGVTLDNAGSCLFGGNNSFSGGLTLRNASRLFLRSTSGLGAAGNVVTLDNGGLGSFFDSPGPLVIDSATQIIIGAGGGIFTASVVPLIITAPLSGTAPIRFSGGGSNYEVRLTHPANTFTGNIQLGDSGFSGSGSAVLGIVADGSLGHAANIVTLGDSFFDGESTRVSQGTLRAFANITLPASRAIRLNGSTDGSGDMGGAFDTNGFNITVPGAITQLAPGMPLEKRGAGTLYLLGTNTYTGQTTVRAGTLGGTGTIGPVLVKSGATLAPGSSPGTLHTGTLDLESNAILALEFAAAGSADQLDGSADQLDITGAVHLAGRLDLSVAPGLATPLTFTIINNDLSDPVSGTLFSNGASLQNGALFTAAGYDWLLSYTGGDGNDVTLTLLRSTAVLTAMQILPGGSVRLTGSGTAGASYAIETSPDLETWTESGQATVAPAGTLTFLDRTAALESRRLYRLGRPVL